MIFKTAAEEGTLELGLHSLRRRVGTKMQNKVEGAWR